MAAAGLGGYSYWEAGELEPQLLDVPIQGLPSGFNGCRIAVLADLHHGWFISRNYIAGALRLANSLESDLIFLLGDYIDSHAADIAPVMGELANLRAPLGAFAVQGNRDILPFIGRPFIPPAYGQKYALGLVQAPHTKTFVTTGVGSIFPTLRFHCPPEVALLTLVKA